MKSLPTKLISETITVEFNFTGQLEFGETIESVAVSVSVWSGLDYAPSALLDSIPASSGLVVSVDVTAGQAGVIYNLTAAATGSTGNIYSKSRRLAVLSDDSSFRPADLPSLIGTLPDATVGVAYSESLTIVGGYAPYEFDDITAGAPPPWMSFNVVDNLLVCAGMPDEMGSVLYEFTPQIRDAVNNLASDPQSMSSLHMELAGDVGDGIIQEAVSGSYTQVHGIEPVTYSVYSGTFPAGVTLASDGSYSGAFTTFAENSWVIKAVDAVGTVAYLDDSNIVGKQLWWLTVSNATDPTQQASLWTTVDFTSWSGPFTRSPNISAGDIQGPFYANGNMMVFRDGTPAELITVQNPSGTTVPTTLVSLTGAGGSRFARAFPSTLFFSDETGHYWLSGDSGASWTQYTSPGGSGSANDVVDMCQIGSNFIVATLTFQANARGYYSGSASSGWTLASSNLTAGNCLICDGSAAVFWGVLQTSHSRTTDGVTWGSISTSFTPRGTGGAAGGGVMIANGSINNIARSTDSGLTWTEVALPVSGTVNSVVYGNNLFVVSVSGGAIGAYLCISADLGLTWQTVTLPYTQSGSSGNALVALNKDTIWP